MPQISILIINTFLHDKNKQGLHNILNSIGKEYEYKFGTAADIPNYDIIYSPSQVINASLYPDKKFIFGPHFSTFPNHQQLQSMQANKNNNRIVLFIIYFFRMIMNPSRTGRINFSTLVSLAIWSFSSRIVLVSVSFSAP